MKYELPLELLQKINPLLQEPLDYKNIDKLKKQLSDLQSIRYELSNERCNLYKKLLDERERMRVPKDKEYTELDRSTIMKATTSMLERDYEFLLSIEVIIKDQIELGITFL